MLGTHYVYRLLTAEVLTWALRQVEFKPLSEGTVMIIKVMRTFRDRDDFERDRGVSDFFETVLPTEELVGSAQGLANAIATLKQQGNVPFLEPYRFEDAGWIANRWCEILPISVAAKQKLMELPDPLVRLKLVDEFLRSKGVVG